MYIYIIVFYSVRGLGQNHVCCTFWCFRQQLIKLVPVLTRILKKSLWNKFYIIIQVILAFWLVLAYDLLEGRRTIDVIISKFFPLCFEMAESFENLDNVLHDWAKDKVQKSLVEVLKRNEKHSLAGRRKIKPFLF